MGADLRAGQQLQRETGRLCGKGSSQRVDRPATVRMDRLRDVHLHPSVTPIARHLRSSAQAVKPRQPTIGSVPTPASPDHVACREAPYGRYHWSLNDLAKLGDREVADITTMVGSSRWSVGCTGRAASMGSVE